MNLPFPLRLPSCMMIGILFFLNYGCYNLKVKKNYNNLNDFIHAPENVNGKPFLKAHHKNGSVYILKNSWKIDTVSNLITGKGSLYDYNRRLLHNGELELNI